ncbi:Curved DNA-binding protein [Burkholderiales bacterium]|nr:Curved DNA-binding protein [Burkholderiales bacterium]
MKYQDYYALLEVPRSATAEEIKKSYRRLARKYHPDVSKEKDAERRMQEINEAYAVLSDPEKRAAYEQLGQHRPGQDFRPPPGWDEGFEFSGRGFAPGEDSEFSDFFAELFGQMGGRRRGGGDYRARGEDHHAKMVIALDDAWTGATRELALRVPQLDAEGRVTLGARTLSVRIPKGVKEGQLIRLTGQGGPGLGGATAGDLYLEVHFAPQERFVVEGRDLHLRLPVAPWEAALGTTLEIPLPAGERVKVRLPAGSQTGRQLRVRGKGIPGEPPGDLFLDLAVMAPEARTPAQKAMYENMAREFQFDARAEWEKNR